MQTSFAYAYDDSGNRTRVIEADGRRVTWIYDAGSRLTGEHRGGTGGYRHTFTYDAAGNRTLKHEDGQRTTYVYDAANQLRYSQAAAGRTTYVYDADGNQELTVEPSGARTTSVWDYENRLTKVLLPSGIRNTMAYEPDGLRVKLEESTGTKRFVWDDQNYLQQTDAAHDTQVEYTSEPQTYGNLVSHRQSGATTYYQFDALGSTRGLSNAGEVLLATYDYGAWGTLLGSPTLLTPFLWVGRVGYHWDAESQNQYVRAQVLPAGRGEVGECGSMVFRSASDYYAPQLTSFEITYGDNTNESTFAYALGCPVIGFDPSGKVWVRTLFRKEPDCPSKPAIVKVAVHLHRKAPCNGFVVQKVTVRCTKSRCGEAGTAEDFSYWEAWRVERGQLRSSQLASAGGDTFTALLNACTIGDYEQLGEIRFYCNSHLGLPESDVGKSIPGRDPADTIPAWYPNSVSGCGTQPAS